MKELGITLMKAQYSVDEQINLLKESIKPPFGCKMSVDLFSGEIEFILHKDFSPDHAYKFVIIDYEKKEYFLPTKEASS